MMIRNTEFNWLLGKLNDKMRENDRQRVHYPICEGDEKKVSDLYQKYKNKICYDKYIRRYIRLERK